MAVDVTAISKQQIDTAIVLAQLNNSEIIVMSVLSDTVLNEDVKTIVVQAITDSLNKVRETLKKEGIKTKEPVIAYGKAEDRILKMAIEEKE